MKTLQLVRKLLEELEKKEISYCHWKSNTAIMAALSGETDLDLLVDEKQEDICLKTIGKLGFRRALDIQDKHFPGISHYFGYDEETGRLVHVHLHFQLLVGDDLIKKYHLPVNRAFLNLSMPVNGVYLPPVELEFIVFVLRMTLKRRLLSVLVRLCSLLGNPFFWMKVLVGITSPPLPPSAQSEFDDLSNRIDPVKLGQTLADHFPFVEMELFQHCWSSLTAGASRYSWLKAGHRLTCALTPYSRYSSAGTVAIIFFRAFKLRAQSLIRRCTRVNLSGKTPESGGRIIAFVGGDGAGKSTMVQETQVWLTRYFSATSLHMGKPKRGFLWFFSLLVLKAWALSGRKSDNDLHQAIKYWLVAYYRYRTFCRAVRLRKNGVVVLLDRVPLPGSIYMDTPRIATLAGAKGQFFQRLARMEEKWHEKIRADELVVMRLDPQIAALRRPDDDPVLLEKRSGEIWNRRWPEAYSHLVDASQPLDEVIRQVRSLIWGILDKKARVLELIGPAGSGKSTLAGELRNRFYNIQTTFSCRDYLLPSLAISLRRLPYLVAGGLRGIPLNHLKRALYTETVLYLLSSNHRRRLFPGRNIVLEIGPLFHLAFLEKESGRFFEKWLKQLRKQIVSSVDLVVWLDAPDELLGKRIKDRSKWHRIKNGVPEEIKDFFADYRACFTRVIDGGEVELPIKNIDTGNLNIAECAEIVTRLLQEPS